jgi:hypothetical protein
MVQAPSVNRPGEVIMNVSTARQSKKWSKKDFLNRVMSGRLSNERALAKLTEQLHQYERKYNMRSEIFYQLIVGTPAEDHPDFIAWAICYRSYLQKISCSLR